MSVSSATGGDRLEPSRQRHRHAGCGVAKQRSAKATITDRGMATGRAVGNTTITATTAGFINDNAVLTVR